MLEKEYECIKCGRRTSTIGLQFENGDILCTNNCKKSNVHSGLCPNCGRFSNRLFRDLKGGFSFPVCGYCRRLSFENCFGCGKNRRTVANDKNGRPLCSACAARNGRPFVCTQCGRKSRYHTSTRCNDCYWRDKCDKLLVDIRKKLTAKWLKNEVINFSIFLSPLKDKHNAFARLKSYGEVFETLDKLCPTPGDLSYELLAQQYHGRLVRSYSAVMAYLASRRILPPLDDERWRRYVSDEAIYRRLRLADQQWYGPILRKYYEYNVIRERNFEKRGWIGEKSKPKPRTVVCRLSAAERFLKTLALRNPDDVRSITQNDVDSFLSQLPGYRNALRHFISYLNKVVKYFKALDIPTKKYPIAKSHIGENRIKLLLNSWFDGKSVDSRTALICTIMALFAQPAVKIVTVKLSDVQELPDGKFSIIVNGRELLLFDKMADLFRRYLSDREALNVYESNMENPFLFPGRMIGHHLSEVTANKLVRTQGVTSFALYASAIWGHYLNGVTHPNVLVSRLGICRETALRYYLATEPYISTRIAEQINR